MNTDQTLILNAFWVDDKPFPSEEKPNTQIGQIFHNEYYDSSRHLGWMDIVQLKEIIKRDSISHLIIQNLDIFGKIVKASHELKICTAYKYKKSRIISNIPKNKDLENCEPLYNIVEFGGWEFSENDDKLPSRAEEYLIHLLYKTKVKSVSAFTNTIKVTVYWKNNHLADILYEKI